MATGARSSWTGLFIRLGLVTALLATFGGCHRPSSPPPTVKPPEPASPGLSGFPDTQAGRAGLATARAARTVGPESEKSYQASLQQLRSHGEAAVAALVTAYRAADPADYGTRGLMVQILAQLDRPEALTPLIEIARAPVPKPTPARDDVLNPFVEESIIRMVAIHGIESFAADRRAQDTLVALLGSDAAPVSEEAARALWTASARMEPKQRDAIRERIPAELRVDPETKLGPVGPDGKNPALLPRTEKK
jgi:hypothetical protein